MTCEFADTDSCSKTRTLNIDELQRLVLRQEKLAEEAWYAPIPYEFFNQCLTDEGMRVVLVGCGTARESSVFADAGDQKPLPKLIVGVDINPKAIEIAKSQALAGEHYQVLDITSSEAAEILLKNNLGPFDIASFIGVLGSLITPETVFQALGNAAKVLKAKGRLIISDFGWWQAEDGGSYWQERYRRDETALRLCGYPGIVFGTIAIHPFGLSNEEMVLLTAQDVAEAIKRNEYERFIRHWQVAQIKGFLEETGFKVLAEKEEVKCWNQAKRFGVKSFEEKERDKLMNYQILAQK